MRRFHALLLGIALLAARPAAAGIEFAETTGASFLTLGPGASLVGMGNTGIAGYPDLSAMAWNPASLGLMSESQWMFTHMPLANSTSQEWLSYGGQRGVAPTRWALSGRYQGDGSFKAYDPLGNLSGTFNASSLALGVNAARPLDQHLVLGLGAKFVNENLGSVSGYGGTLDAGIVYQAGPLSLGAAAQNMGGPVKYDSLAYSMPVNFGAGLALAHARSGLRMTVDFNHPIAYYDDVRAGAEWLWRRHLAVRVGFRHELNAPTYDPMNSTSIGFGGGGHGLWFDYGYMVSGDATSQQRLTLRVSPRSWGPNYATDEDHPNPSGGTSREGSAQLSSQPAPKPAAPASSTSSAATSSAASSSAPAPAKPVATSAAPAAAATATPKPTGTPTPKPTATAPGLTTLVPVTPPAVPAPKPVAASHPATQPTVSAPAPQSKPSEAPVTNAASQGSTANQSAAASASPSGKDKNGRPADDVTASASAVVATTPAVESAVRPDGKPVKIHVKKDETLDSIAKRFGTTKAALMMENNMASERIRPGQELRIPNHR